MPRKKNKIPFFFFFFFWFFSSPFGHLGRVARSLVAARQAKSFSSFFFLLFGSSCEISTRSLNTLGHRQSISITKAKPATLSWPDSFLSRATEKSFGGESNGLHCTVNSSRQHKILFPRHLFHFLNQSRSNEERK